MQFFCTLELIYGFVVIALFIYLFCYIKKSMYYLGKKRTLCRGPFFQSTVDQVQHPSDPPGVQNPASPVIHGRRNMKRNGLKAIHQAQTPNQLTKAQPIHSSNSSLPHKEKSEINSEKERENGCLISTIFPSSLDTVLEALRGDIPKEELDLPSY